MKPINSMLLLRFLQTPACLQKLNDKTFCLAIYSPFQMPTSDWLTEVTWLDLLFEFPPAVFDQLCP